MNVNDVEKIDTPTDDMLKLIFAQQRKHMLEYDKIEAKNGCLQTDKVPVDIDSYVGQARLKDFIYRTIEELCEAGGCLKLRPWKQTPYVTDRVHFYEEIADAMHFFVEFMILAGLGPDDIFDLYFKKSKVNEFRRDSKY